MGSWAEVHMHARNHTWQGAKSGLRDWNNVLNDVACITFLQLNGWSRQAGIVGGSRGTAGNGNVAGSQQLNTLQSNSKQTDGSCNRGSSFDAVFFSFSRQKLVISLAYIETYWGLNSIFLSSNSISVAVFFSSSIMLEE